MLVFARRFMYDGSMKTSHITSRLLFFVPIVVISSLLLSACDFKFPWSPEPEPEESSECVFSEPEFVPTTRGEQLLVDYFSAMNDKDYDLAFTMLSDDIQSSFATNFEGEAVEPADYYAEFYGEHVECVQVTDIVDVSSSAPEGDLVSASLGLHWYRVTFEATYLEYFIAGSETLPAFYKVQADPHADMNEPNWGEIVSIVTGL